MPRPKMQILKSSVPCWYQWRYVNFTNVIVCKTATGALCHKETPMKGLAVNALHA